MQAGARAYKQQHTRTHTRARTHVHTLLTVTLILTLTRGTDCTSNVGSDVDIYDVTDVASGTITHWKTTGPSTPEPSLVGLSETFWVYAGGFAYVIS